MSKLTSNLNGNHNNMQYSPPLAKRLLNFCKYITCWSAVMVSIFGYGNLTESSATSESMFKDLKSIVFKHKTLPVRLDEFFKTHVESIIGSIHLIKTSADQSKDEKSNFQHKLISEIQDESKQPFLDVQQNPENPILNNYDEPKKNLLDFTEDWMGLGKPQNKTKNSKYLTKDPAILYCNDNSRTKSSVIGVLRNGSMPELKSIRIDNEYVSFKYVYIRLNITSDILCLRR